MPNSFDLEIMHPHLFRLSLRSQLPPCSFFLVSTEITDCPGRQPLLDLHVSVFKLRVAVRMLRALQRLTVGLQAIVHRLEQFRHRLVVRHMS